MKTAVISGVSSGIGLEVARRLIAEKYLVIGCSRNEPPIGDILFFRCDIRKTEEVEAFARFVKEKVSHIDILINNAGMTYVKKFEEFKPEEIDEIMETNTTGIMKKTLLLLPLLKEGSIIINLGSIAAVMHFPEWSVYNASKYALRGWSKALRKELSEKGIRVTLINPGAVWTPFWEKIGFERAYNMLSAEDVAQVIMDVIHLPPHVDVEELLITHVRRAH